MNAETKITIQVLEKLIKEMEVENTTTVSLTVRGLNDFHIKCAGFVIGKLCNPTNEVKAKA
jgi:hypothetical protein